jgi:type I phosphodiesterase/nucleotide pyrophosphatase
MLLPILLSSLSAFPQAPAADGVRLAVVLVVDQMPAEMVERFAPMFEGGFARLLREGTLFTDCAHDHALTETGPGHAALLSGRHPGTVGIVENQWFDAGRKEVLYCVGDPAVARLPAGEGASPARFLGDSLGDWMKRDDPASKVVTVSGKDRSAVLMGGRKPDGAYWACEAGFATSTYYRSELPPWLSAWNGKERWKEFAGKVWPGRLGEDLLAKLRVGPDDQPGERLFDGAVFPHRLPPLPAATAVLPFTPFADDLVLEVAREAIAGEELGADGHPDLLCVGLSAADYVGHMCGSRSREVAEHFDLLDEALGAFLSFVEERAGKGRVLFALSSDHGVLDLPERLSAPARRLVFRGKEDLGVPGAKKAIAAALGEGEWIAFHDYRSIYLDRDLCSAKGIDRGKAAEEVAKAFRPLDWVAEAYTRADLLAAEPKDPYVPLFRHSFHPDRSGDVFLRHKENVLVFPGRAGTTHGGPYPCDRAVPLAFLGPGFGAGKRAESVHALDLAPTLAEALGVPLPEGVEGRSRFAPARADGGR